MLIKSGKGEIYTRFEKRLKTSLTDIDKTNVLTSKDINTFNLQFSTQDIAKYDAIISAGIEASIAVSNMRIHKTTFMSMLPRESFTKLSASGEIKCNVNSCSVIFLGQPVIRQLELIKLALPDTKQIAVISSNYSDHLLDEISKSAARLGLTVNRIQASDEGSVLSALNRNLSNADILMAIPDPVVFNRNTARAILLSAFHQRLPLFAYSRSFVRAGATFAIYSTPEDIARNVAELLSGKSLNSASGHTIYPKYFTIDVNRRAADALNIMIPDIQFLENRLKKHDK